MTQSFQNMLYLMGGNGSQITTDLDIERIRAHAISQGVWTLVFPELEKHADLSQYMNEFIGTVSDSIRRNAFQLQTISELNEAGYNTCLLKGAAVSLAYPDPSCRVSWDTDVLIDPEQEQDVIAFLEERGYTLTEKRTGNYHHFQIYHPIGGTLEGHVRLYSILKEKILFDGLQMYSGAWTTEEIEGYTIPILDLDDGLMFLTAHYIKHLIIGGGGVRQMMDLLLYIEHYKDKLDFERYNDFLRELRYDKLIDVVKTIGAKYWGFDYPIKYEELAEKILTDSESVGIFGHDENLKDEFYSEYCDRRAENAANRIQATIMEKNDSGMKNVFFPSQKLLLQRKQYQYAKHKILIPVAWVHRFFAYVIKKWTRHRNAKNSVTKDRLNLMRELKMIN